MRPQFNHLAQGHGLARSCADQIPEMPWPPTVFWYSPCVLLPRKSPVGGDEHTTTGRRARRNVRSRYGRAVLAGAQACGGMLARRGHSQLSPRAGRWRKHQAPVRPAPVSSLRPSNVYTEPTRFSCSVAPRRGMGDCLARPGGRLCFATNGGNGQAFQSFAQGPGCPCSLSQSVTRRTPVQR